MSNFIERFAPLIFYTISNMNQLITSNPYGSASNTLSEQPDYTAVTLPLKIYNSNAPEVQTTREERFGKLQARVELPVRVYTLVIAYREYYAIKTTIQQISDYIICSFLQVINLREVNKFLVV